MYLQAGSTNNAIDVFNAAGTTQLFKLTGTGAATFSSSVTATELYLSTSNGVVGNINSSNANGGYITWQTSGTTIADIGTATQIFGSGGNDVFGINGRGARAIAFGTNNTERMRITSGGNIGIGTSTISNTAGFSRQVQIEGTYPALTLKNVTGTAGSYSLGAGSNGDFGIWNNTTSSYPMYVNSSNAVTFISSIKTGAPSGGTAGAWKLGTATSGTFIQGGKVRIEIDGVAYDLLTT
jgi:hypothetical protein